MISPMEHIIQYHAGFFYTLGDNKKITSGAMFKCLIQFKISNTATSQVLNIQIMIMPLDITEKHNDPHTQITWPELLESEFDPATADSKI